MADDSIDVFSEDRYCNQNFIDLDLTEQQRLQKTQIYLEKLAAASKINVFFKAANFVYNNPNFIIGFTCSTIIVGTFVITYSQACKFPC